MTLVATVDNVPVEVPSGEVVEIRWSDAEPYTIVNSTSGPIVIRHVGHREGVPYAVWDEL